MTKKFDDFKRELIELCERHQVVLSTSASGNIIVCNVEPESPWLVEMWLDDTEDETAEAP